MRISSEVFSPKRPVQQIYRAHARTKCTHMQTRRAAPTPTHTHTRTHTHTHTHTHKHAQTHTHTRARTHTHSPTNTHTHTLETSPVSWTVLKSLAEHCSLTSWARPYRIETMQSHAKTLIPGCSDIQSFYPNAGQETNWQ
jgi:hypothetical protein